MTRKAPLDFQLNTNLDSNKTTSSKIFIDPLLFLSLLAILIFGLFVLYSASGQSINMVSRQAVYIVFGLILMVFISRLDQSLYKDFLMHLFWLGLILLLWVLIFPAKGYSTDRWIDLGLLSFQPSETVRLFLPLAIAAYLTRKQKKPFLKDWAVVILAISISSFLIYKQPDLGTALIVFTSGFIPVFLSGFPISILLICLVLISAISPILWTSLSPYMQGRVITLINPNLSLIHI